MTVDGAGLRHRLDLQHIRQWNESSHKRKQQRETSQHNIGRPNRACQFGSSCSRRNKDERRTNLRRAIRRKRVEESADADPGCGRLRLPQRANIRIDSHLQQSKPAADDKQPKQKHRIRDDNRGRNEDKQPAGHRAQRSDDPWLIADPAHDQAGRYRHHEIGAEKAGLHQQRPHIAQVKDVLEVGHQDVVQRRDESDAEEERHHQHHGHYVVLAPGGANRRALRPCHPNRHSILLQPASYQYLL